MSRFISTLALGILLVACQNGAKAPTPSPSPSPRTTVAAAVIQPGEVPSGLIRCSGSGPIAGYLAALQPTDAALAARITDQWQQLKSKGATAAAITLYSSDPSACTAELAAAPKTRSLSSFAARFADEGQAERVWVAGVLGFATPAPDQLASGILRGSATGLGVSSWTYTSTQVRLACWRRSVFVSLVVLTNLDPAAYKAVTAAIDARLN